LVWCLALVVGCGDDGGNPVFEGPDGGPIPDAGPIVDASPVTPDAAVVDPDGPVVAIVSPTAPAANDFSSEAIVTASGLEIVCEVTPSSTTNEIVDPTTVTVSVISSTGALAEAIATPTGNLNEYSGTIDLRDFDNGSLSVRCAASDLGGRTNSATVDTFLDLGPRISVFNPVESTSYGGSVAVSFTVLPEPVAPSDSLADVNLGSVQLFIAGESFAVSNPSPNVYTATVSFDAAQFTPPLDGTVSLEVRASNSRTSAAVTRSTQLVFIADNDGPNVTITSPGSAELVSGFVTISATVDDSAGVTDVSATVDDIEVEMTNTSGTTWEGSIDTRLLDGVYPLVLVRALDVVGNESSAGRVIALDNRPPIVDLDSIAIREGNCVNNTAFCDLDDVYECSQLIDPSGFDAVSDGQTVPQLSEFRVRVEDQANIAFSNSGVSIPIADVDPATVTMLVLDDSSLDLLIDTNEDGFCDAINPAVVPKLIPQGGNEAARVDLAALAVAGVSHLSSNDDLAFGDDAGRADDQCLRPLEAPLAPPELCLTTELSRFISASYSATLPAMYAIPPFNPDCGGNAFDALASNISDGWACVAAVAEDNLGNVGVSAPLRVCFDKDGDGLDDQGLALVGCADVNVDVNDPSFPPIGTPPMTCTDGCTPVRFSNFAERNVILRDTTVRECADGIDNDADNFIDGDDPDCVDGDYQPNDPSEAD
jgi:hypothetical protein